MSNRFDVDVIALLDANRHPLRKEIDLLREIILDTDKSILEGVKWNAASFRTTQWFATLNGPKRVDRAEVILHGGAKVKHIDLRKEVPDPERLIEWLGKDRGIIYFNNAADVNKKSQALQNIMRAWIELI